MKRGQKDFYYTQAKQSKYVARSVYKLAEIDNKHKLFTHLISGTVVEFGLSPGSWFQYYRKRIGPKVWVVGIDTKPCKIRIDHGIFVQQDISLLTAPELLSYAKGNVKMVISDALPALTGNRVRDHSSIAKLRDAITDLMRAILAPGGMWVMKTFDCPTHGEWLRRCRGWFRDFVIEKPKASRKESPEIYVVGKHYLGKEEGE